jgi:hypothetical protein
MDEAIRMKPSRLSYIVNRWPLIEKEMHRYHCLRWCAERQYPKPAKSACTFCPYTDNVRWRDMRDNDPTSFADAVFVDKAIRNIPAQRERWFVHRDRVPLDEVDLSTAEDRGQLNMFNNECEGMCGV